MVIAFYKSILPKAEESINSIKKYQFIECGKNRWKNGFTEIRKFGTYRYFIRHEMNNNWSICHNEDMDSVTKYFLRLNGYN